MKKTPVHVVGAICVASLMGGVVTFGASALHAGTSRDTATASATIQALASVGLVTTTTTTTTSTSTSIPSIPISTTSNVGYGSPAPVPPVDGAGASGAAASSGTSATPAQAARGFAARGAAPISIGGASAVAVAGAPNQTFNVILPGNTSFASGGNVVNLSGFQHSAGATPALGSDGSGTFSIGAAVDAAGAPDGASSGGDTPSEDAAAEEGDGGSSGGDTPGAPPTVLAAAFTQQSPFVNIVVAYN